MIRPDDDQAAALRSAVAAIWRAGGQTPPSGSELARAATLLGQTLAAGARLPRTPDKTVQPLYGPRTDIERPRSSRSCSRSSDQALTTP